MFMSYALRNRWFFLEVIGSIVSFSDSALISALRNKTSPNILLSLGAIFVTREDGHKQRTILSHEMLIVQWNLTPRANFKTCRVCACRLQKAIKSKGKAGKRDRATMYMSLLFKGLIDSFDIDVARNPIQVQCAALHI